jgi:hypothetical protein
MKMYQMSIILLLGCTSLYSAKDLLDINSGTRLSEIQDLKQRGGDVNMQDRDGKTPLLMAIGSGKDDIVSYLILAGAKINQADKDGYTPLLLALDGEHWSIADFLIRQKANVNTRRPFGQTPLYYAIKGGNPSMVKLLIQNGARLDDADNLKLLGRTDLDYVIYLRDEAGPYRGGLNPAIADTIIGIIKEAGGKTAAELKKGPAAPAAPQVKGPSQAELDAQRRAQEAALESQRQEAARKAQEEAQRKVQEAAAALTKKKEPIIAIFDRAISQLDTYGNNVSTSAFGSRCGSLGSPTPLLMNSIKNAKQAMQNAKDNMAKTTANTSKAYQPALDAIKTAVDNIQAILGKGICDKAGSLQKRYQEPIVPIAQTLVEAMQAQAGFMSTLD